MCYNDIIISLPIEIAEDIRQDCAIALRHAKRPRWNVSKAEILAFNRLIRNNDIVISKANKGNAMVIMNKHDYVVKMDVLSHSSMITLPKF